MLGADRHALESTPVKAKSTLSKKESSIFWIPSSSRPQKNSSQPQQIKSTHKDGESTLKKRQNADFSDFETKSTPEVVEATHRHLKSTPKKLESTPDTESVIMASFLHIFNN